jgi:hypothetical protein
MKTWACFIQDNFDKLLLALIFLGSCVLVIHLAHDSRDGDLILWGREIAGTVLGALLGLITGHALANARMTATTTGNPPQTTVATETK